jgi:hypothetical protein
MFDDQDSLVIASELVSFRAGVVPDTGLSHAQSFLFPTGAICESQRFQMPNQRCMVANVPIVNDTPLTRGVYTININRVVPTCVSRTIPLTEVEWTSKLCTAQNNQHGTCFVHASTIACSHCESLGLTSNTINRRSILWPV